MVGGLLTMVTLALCWSLAELGSVTVATHSTVSEGVAVIDDKSSVAPNPTEAPAMNHSIDSVKLSPS